MLAVSEGLRNEHEGQADCTEIKAGPRLAVAGDPHGTRAAYAGLHERRANKRGI